MSGGVLRPFPNNLWTPGKQVRPVGVPRIDWTHPLAKGLWAYWWPLESGSGYINLVTGDITKAGTGAQNTLPVPKATAYGTAPIFNTTTAFCESRFTDTLNWNAPYAIVCGFVQVANASSTNIGYFGIGDASGNNAMVVISDGTLATKFDIAFNNTTPPFSFTYALNTFYVAVGSAVSANLNNSWVNGVAQTAGTQTEYTNLGAQGYVFGSVSYTSGSLSSCGAAIFFGAVWRGRALTARDAILIYTDPYCFLLPPEAEMPALFVGITAFSMTASTGNYTLTGENSTLLKKSIDNIQSGSYALTDEQLTLKAGRKLNVQETPYTLTGEQITALKKSILNIQEGTYTTSSQPVLKKTSLQNIQEVPYALTVETLTTKKGYTDKAQSGSYALTVEQVTELKTSVDKLQTGTYTTTSQPVFRKTSLQIPQTAFYEIGPIIQPVLANVWSVFDSTASLTQSITLPRAPTAGNLVVIGFAWETGSAATFTCSDGTNSYTPTTSTPFSAAGPACQIGIFYLPNVPAGAGATVTITSSVSAKAGIWAIEVSNAALSSVLETDGTATGSVNNVTSPSFTTVNNGDLIFAVGVSNGSMAANSPFQNVNATEDGNLGEYYIQPSQGAQGVGFTQGSGGNSWGTIGAVFKAALGNTRLLKSSLLNAQMVPYSLTVESLTLLTSVVSFLMNIATGNYALTGENETLLKASKAFVQAGFYALTGENETLKKASLQALQEGSYSFTGEQLKLLEGHVAKIQSGSYVLTDEQITLIAKHLATVQSGTYSLTGEQITAIVAHLQKIQEGGYALTGEQVGMIVSHLAKVQTGNYALTVEQLTELWKHLNAIQTGFYNLTDESLTLIVTVVGSFLMSIATGNYALTDEIVTLLWDRLNKIPAGYYELSGLDVARSFNGSSDRLIASPVSMTNCSMACWVKLNNTSQLTRIFGQGASSGVNAGMWQAFSFNEDNPTFFSVSVDGEATTIPSLAAPSSGQWYHLAFTYTTAPLLTFYVNGVSQGTNNSTINTSHNDTLSFGCNPQQAAAFLNGSLADCAVWNTNLSPAQVSSLAAGARANTVASANLIGDWPILGQAPEPDLSGNGNKATVTGTSVVAGPTAFTGFEAETLLKTSLAKAQPGIYDFVGGYPLGNGIVAHYTMDSVAGGVVSDASGNGNTLTLTTPADFTVVSGVLASAVHANGSSNATTAISWSGTTGTIALWLNLDALTAPRGFLNTASSLFARIVNGTGLLEFGCHGGGTVNIGTATAGVWCHVAMTWNGSSGTAYFNGAFNQTAGLVTTPSLTNLTVWNDDTGDIAGAIDELLIYNRQLTGSEIKSLFNFGAGNETLLWNHVENVQMTPYALTGESLTLTISGGQTFSISIGTGTYALTDESLTLTKASKAGLQVGTYSLTDEALQTLKGSRLANTTGTYTLTDEALTLTVGHRVTPQTGFYAFTSALTFRKKSLMSSAAGFYTVTGNGVTFLTGVASVPIVSTPTLFGIDVGTTLRGGDFNSQLFGS